MTNPQDLAAALVTPNANAPAPAPQTPPTAAAPSLPKMPPALMKIPAVSGLLTGKPGAFSLPIKESKGHEDLQDLAKHKDWLGKAGMYVYSALDGKTGVVANSLYVHPEELKAADAAGQLSTIAPPFDQVNHLIGKSGTAHPALNTGHQVPTALKGAPSPQPPQMGGPASPVAPPPASTQKSQAVAQLRNMQPGSPTSGPLPGQGRLLNSILKPVV